MPKVSLIAVAAGILLAFPAAAQESFPGTLFSVPDPGGPTYEAADDQEVVTDLPIFLKRGYSQPDWKVHERSVLNAATETVVPDYEKRTGKKAADVEGRVEIAAAMLTNPDFRDMITASRLDGDCDEKGCLYQVWSLDILKKWKKVLEFKALAVAYRLEDDGTHWMVAVGDSIAPTRMFLWDGRRYLPQ